MLFLYVFIVLEHVKQRLLIWSSMSSDLQIINNRGISRSVSARFLHCCAPSAAGSIRLLGSIKVVLSNYVGFKARLDHPKTMLQDIAAKLKCSRDGLGLWLPWAPSGNFGCRYHIDLVIDTFIYSKMSNIWKLFLEHSLCFPQRVSWQVLAASSVVPWVHRRY